VQRRLLLDVVVGKGASILQLLAGEDQSLLIRRNTLLVLDLGLDVIDSVRRLDIQGDGLTWGGLCNSLNLIRSANLKNVNPIGGIH
jgi:hypothetical protein